MAFLLRRDRAPSLHWYWRTCTSLDSLLFTTNAAQKWMMGACHFVTILGFVLTSTSSKTKTKCARCIFFMRNYIYFHVVDTHCYQMWMCRFWHEESDKSWQNNLFFAKTRHAQHITRQREATKKIWPICKVDCSLTFCTKKKKKKRNKWRFCKQCTGILLSTCLAHNNTHIIFFFYFCWWLQAIAASQRYVWKMFICFFCFVDPNKLFFCFRIVRHECGEPIGYPWAWWWHAWRGWRTSWRPRRDSPSRLQRLPGGPRWR